MLTGQGRWAISRRFLFFQAMSEEQLKAAEIEATTEQVEEGVEEISEEDLEGVAGGMGDLKAGPPKGGFNGGNMWE